MGERESGVVEEIKHALTFKDKDGQSYVLSPSSYKHIKRDHSIEDPYSFICDTLLDPFAITEDKTKNDRWIYHRDYKSGLYKVVVVCTTEMRIKTAFISDVVKGGIPIWVSKNLIR